MPASGPRAFQPVKSTDEEITLLQNRIKETFDWITSNPFVAGKLIPGVSLQAGSNLVSHGLGRGYISFFMGQPSQPVRLSTGQSPDRSTYVNVIADTACTVDLLVI